MPESRRGGAGPPRPNPRNGRHSRGRGLISLQSWVVSELGHSWREIRTKPPADGQEDEDELEAPAMTTQVHATFPLPEGSVSLSFPAEMSVASAQIMASCCWIKQSNRRSF